jgi:Rieske Fe-S protein
VLTRRHFLRVAGLTLGAGLLATLRSLADRLSALQPRPRVVTLPAELPQDIVFVDEVVVCRTGDEIRAFSARCTHLGCLITQQSDGLLVCPCHGSRFHVDGTVARGPASRPLQALAHRIDPKSGAIVVQVS